jgi:hypothetical protein
MATPTGLNSPAHTGKAVTPTSPIPAGQPGGPLAGKPQQNGLAAFANSDLGQMLSKASALYGPSQMSGYPDAFQGALQAARGNIAQQLQGALGDIQGSQDHAMAALGQYAPQVNTAWQEGTGMADNAQKTSAAALAKYGIGSQVAKADMAPERLAMNATHQNDLSDQSLLQTGIDQQAMAARAQAQLAAQDRQGQLDQLQAQLSSQQAMAAQQQQYAQANALQQFGLNALNNAQQYQAQKGLAAGQAQQNQNPATGRYANTGLTEGQILTAQHLPQYARYNQMITGLKAGSQEANVAAGQIMQATAGNPVLQQLLMTDNPDFFAGAIPVNQQASSSGANPLAKVGQAVGSGGLNNVANPSDPKSWLNWLKPKMPF